MSSARSWFTRCAAALLGGAVLLSVRPVSVRAQAETPHYQTDFPPDEFKARWAKIDPQLRIRDANGNQILYMRYEDVGVVTENGFENFTAFMPTTLDEIERTVRMKGMVQDYPPESKMVWKRPRN